MLIEDAIIKTEALIEGEKSLAKHDKAYIDPEHIEALDVLVATARAADVLVAAAKAAEGEGAS